MSNLGVFLVGLGLGISLGASVVGLIGVFLMRGARK